MRFRRSWQKGTEGRFVNIQRRLNDHRNDQFELIVEIPVREDKPMKKPFGFASSHILRTDVPFHDLGEDRRQHFVVEFVDAQRVEMAQKSRCDIVSTTA